jgi:trimeric autotransporter adhesin
MAFFSITQRVALVLAVLFLSRAVVGQVLVEQGVRPRTYLGPLGPQPKALPGIDIVGSLGILSDPKGNIYLGSLGAGRIIRIDAVTRKVAVVVEGRKGPLFAGTTPVTAPSMKSPLGFAFDEAGDLFVADADDHRVRKMDAATGKLSVVAGTGKPGFSGDGGPAERAQLWYPSGLAVSKSGEVYIADSLNQRIRRVAADGTISTVAGGPNRGFNHTGVPGTEAMLQFPTGCAIDLAGNLLFADVYNNRIWKLDTRSGLLTTAVGTGQNCSRQTAISGEGEPPDKTMLVHPNSVLVDPAGNIFIVEGKQNPRGPSRRLIRVNAASNTVEKVVDFGANESDRPSTRNPNDVAMDPAGKIYLVDDTVGEFGVITMTPPQMQERIDYEKAALARNGPTIPFHFFGIVVAGGELPWPMPGYSGDGGQATAAQINAANLAVNPKGDIFFTEPMDNRIRKIAADTGVITTVAGDGKPGFSGDGGPGAEARINAPLCLALDDAGNLYFSDNNRIRRVDAANGFISTVAGTGISGTDIVEGAPATATTIGNQMSIALDHSGGLYYNAAYAVGRADLNSGTVSRYVGTHEQGFSGDGGPAKAAQLVGLLDWYACDPDGNLYISEGWSLRRVDARSGIITTPLGIINGRNAHQLLDGAPANSVTMGGPFVVDRARNIYIFDRSDLWKMEASTGKMRLVMRDLAGTGIAINAKGDLFLAMTNMIEKVPAEELSH